MNSRRTIFWSDASRGGLISGLFFALFAILLYFFREEESMIALTFANIFQFIGAIIAPLMLTNRFISRTKEWGATYTQILGFMVMVLIFAGVIYGATNYFIFSIDLDYAHEIIASSAKIYGLEESFKEQDFSALFSSPIFMIINSVFSVLLYSIFPALIISAVLRRRANKNNLTK